MTEPSKTPSNSNWNYHPELPLADNSIFKWPPDPNFAANWLRTNWLNLSERVLMLLLAILLWIWVYPDLEAAKEFSSGWIAQVWIINLALLSSIAGGLHLWFIKYNKQNKNLKFDRRDQGKNNKLWNFSDQVKDNMFWSLGSGVIQLTAFQVVTMWMMANGYAPYRNAQLKSYLVSSGIFAAPNMVGLSFLLGAQVVTCPAPLQKSALYTSSQRQHWPMVWIIHASS